MIEALAGAIKEKIDQAETVMVAGHVRPDGDAIGSVIGLGLALEEAGKNVEMVLTDGVPKDFDFLEGSDRVKTKRSEQVDVVIVVDTADRERAGRALDGIDVVDINIDHHVSNTEYGEINLVVEAVSASEIIMNLIPRLGLEFTPAVRTALMTGLITDSQGFRTQNMTADALRSAAAMVEQGVDLPEIYLKALTRKSFVGAKYWGAGLSHMEQKDGVVWTTLSLEDRKAAEYPGRDDADLVNFLARIDEAEVAVLMIEQSEKKVKVSWRAKGNHDVAEVAAKFGGGGHTAAAGAMVEGSLSEVQDKVIEETLKVLLEKVG